MPKRRRLGMQKIGDELCLTRSEWNQVIVNAGSRCADLYESKAQRTICMTGFHWASREIISEFSEKGLHGRKRRR